MSSIAVTILDQIAELKRELAVRQHVYSSWIRKGTMTQENADRQVARMKAALHTLLELQEEALYDALTIKLTRLRTEEGMPE